MIVIDSNGNLAQTPLTETVELRPLLQRYWRNAD